MNLAALLTALFTFLLALLVGTFVEYWGHRLMHVGGVLKKRHARHHQQGSGQGWLGEFRDYLLPSLIIVWVGFLHSPAAGVGFLVGDVVYAAFAAYAHQLQHERPLQVFWLSQPVHAVHHYHQEWHHNFGIAFDFWDRVFGTYKAHEPVADFASLESDQGRLDIHWASMAPPLPRHPRPWKKAA